MKLMASDLAQKESGWRMRESAPHHKKPRKRTVNTLLDNPTYVADLKSGMKQREICDKWQLSQPVVSRHRLALKEAEYEH